MARISGVDIPSNKRVEIALTYVYGIGPNRARRIMSEAKIDSQTRVKDLTDADIGKIKSIIEDNFDVEGALRKESQLNIKRLIDIRAFRGIMHRKGLPVRGQRTKTNARTRKGPTKLPVKKKQKAGKK